MKHRKKQEEKPCAISKRFLSLFTLLGNKLLYSCVHCQKVYASNTSRFFSFLQRCTLASLSLQICVCVYLAESSAAATAVSTGLDGRDHNKSCKSISSGDKEKKNLHAY